MIHFVAPHAPGGSRTRELWCSTPPPLQACDGEDGEQLHPSARAFPLTHILETLVPKSLYNPPSRVHDFFEYLRRSCLCQHDLCVVLTQANRMVTVVSSFGPQRGVALSKAISVSGAALSYYYFAAGSSTCEMMGSLFSFYPLPLQ